MDPTLIMIAIALVAFIAFNWWSSRKRREAAEKLRTTIQPGVEVMTNFGLYGTVVSIDEAAKITELQIAPKVVVKVHSNTVLKAITEEDKNAPRSVEEAMAIANAEAEAAAKAELNVDHAIPLGEPEYGERIAAPKKPSTPRTAKKDAK
jgi:preprotein translocase subunit YajC